MEIFKLFGSVFVKTDEAEKSLSKTDKSAKGLMGSFGNVVASAGKLAIGVAAAAGTAAVALGVTATKAAVDFEKQMSNVATLLDGDVKTRVGELSESVKNLSKDTGTSTDLMTDGLYQVISAFGDTEDAMGILETAAKGAKAGNATVTDSVNLLSAVTKGYGDTSEEAAKKASDLAFNTVKLGQTTFPELAASMGKVIPLAGSLKVSQEELFGATATLTGVTGGTAEVTTQLRATLQGLMKPTKDMQVALTSMGYESGAAALESLGLQGVLNGLKDEVGGNDVALSNMFGSVEAGTAVLALTGAQAENFTEKTKSMYEAAGATQEAFDVQMDNVNAKWEKLKNTWDVLLITLGEKFLPALGSLLDFVNENMPIIESVITSVFEAIGIAITFLSEMFSSTIGSMNLSWETFGTGLQYIWDTYGQPLFDALMPLIQAFSDNWGTIWTTAQSLFQTTWEIIKGLWESIGKPVFDLIVSLIGIVAGVFAEHMPAITSFFSTMASDIKVIWETSLKPAFDAIKAFIENVLAPAFKFVFENGIRAHVESAFNFIKSIWENTLKPVLVGIGDFLTGVFTGNFSQAFNGISTIVEGVMNGLIAIVKYPINTMIGLVNGFIGGLNKMKVPDWVPGLGGKGINMPTIPLLAKGGHVFGDGNAIVGEAGPELLTKTAKGVKVTPLSAEEKSKGIGGALNTDKQAEIIINLDGYTIAKALVDVIDMLQGRKVNIDTLVAGG